jgi:hypothetical protein
MHSELTAALGDGLWITRRRADDGGERGRIYEVCDAAGAVLLSARSSVWGRDIPMRGTVHEEVLLLRRRRAFPLTGRVDMLKPDGRLAGAVYRSGRFADASGRTLGRFRDARTMRARTREAALQAVVEALLGSDGAGSQTSGPTGYVCMNGRAVVGTLAHGRQPFERESADEPSMVARISARVLPQRAVQALRSAGAPRGWRLEVATHLAAAHPLLVTGAALFTVELSYW